MVVDVTRDALLSRHLGGRLWTAPRLWLSGPVIDLHCHVLPGIDDGPATIEDSIALARAAAAGGTRTIVATPHVSWRYPNKAETIERLTREVALRGVPLN